MTPTPVTTPRRRATVTLVCAPLLLAGLALSASPAAAASSPSASSRSAADVYRHLPSLKVDRLPAAIGGVKNLDVGIAGTLVAADSSEDSVTVVRLIPVGRRVVTRTLATLPGGSAQAAQNARGTTWVVYGAAGGPEEAPNPNVQGPSAWLVDSRGRATEVLDIAQFQEQHSPDPYDLEDLPGDSNPYDVEVLPDGSALVADAAGNDLLRVWPNGRAVTVACFPDEVVPTDTVPPPVLEETGPLPPMLPAETVPTGVALGPDGYAYVSELKGFPFPLNKSKVWKVDPDAQDAGCSGDPGNPVPPGTIAASGFSGINDVTVDRKGALYVTELSTDGVWSVELGFEDPSVLIGKGRVTMVRNGTSSTVGHTPLTVPGSAAVTSSGAVYVSNEHLLGAQLTRIR